MNFFFNPVVRLCSPAILNKFILNVHRNQAFALCRFFTSYKTSYSTQSSSKIVSEIPCVRQLPLLKHIVPIELMLNGGAPKLHDFIDNRHKKLGPIFQEQLGPIKSIFVSDAGDIRKIFANEGKYPKHVLPESWLLYNRVKNYKRGIYFM